LQIPCPCGSNGAQQRNAINHLRTAISALRSHYGAPTLPPVTNCFEHVIWENACYLLPDERRLEVFERLRKEVGLDAKSISTAGTERLLPIATRGGMRPEVRVFRWQEIARITLLQFAGDLDQILEWPYEKAKKALKQFPNIADPGAEKILMYLGRAEGLPLEWNGVRVLTRLGYGRVHLKNYAAMYRSVQTDIAPELPRKAADLARAHLLLRQHGKQLCRNNAPLCRSCPLSDICAYPQKSAKKMFVAGSQG
jgi:endonuclease-3